jgi:hypothetical protein
VPRYATIQTTFGEHMGTKNEKAGIVGTQTKPAQTDRPELDLGSIKNTPLARLAGKASIRRAMRPAFEADVERTSFMLETGAGGIEASFDQGAIEAKR